VSRIDADLLVNCSRV